MQTPLALVRTLCAAFAADYSRLNTQGASKETPDLLFGSELWPSFGQSAMCPLFVGAGEGRLSADISSGGRIERQH
jgi:hypothetical protein